MFPLSELSELVNFVFGEKPLQTLVPERSGNGLIRKC